MMIFGGPKARINMNDETGKNSWQEEVHCGA